MLEKVRAVEMGSKCMAGSHGWLKGLAGGGKLWLGVETCGWGGQNAWPLGFVVLCWPLFGLH